ncbi:hypothetical protein [Bradyrhizobium sp. LB13.1]
MAKKTRRSRRSARVDASVSAAIRSGQAMAEEVIAFRTARTRKRSAAVRRMARAPKPRRAPAATQIPSRTRALLGSPVSAGVLIAEGDSWFDYPFHDVLQMLEDDYLYDVESVAHKGDTVDDMAHSGGQFEEFARRLEKLLRANKVPRAILLSGGGNDIAGDEFAILLNHAASSLPAINDDIARGLIDVRLRAAYARIISGLTMIAQDLSRAADSHRDTRLRLRASRWPGLLGRILAAARPLAGARIPEEGPRKLRQELRRGRQAHRSVQRDVEGRKCHLWLWTCPLSESSQHA